MVGGDDDLLQPVSVKGQNYFLWSYVMKNFLISYMTIQEFNSAMNNHRDQLAMTESAELQGFTPYVSRNRGAAAGPIFDGSRDDF